MGRIACLAVLAVTVLGAAGCGTREAGPAAATGPEAALLTVADLPEGYLPAAPHEVFRGVVPLDRDCAALLTLADGRGLRAAAPPAVAVFYQADPGATLGQRIVRLGARGARRAVAEARRLIAACPSVEAPAGESLLRLDRVPLQSARLAAVDTAAAAYRRETPDGGRVSYEVVAHRIGGDLLLVAGPALLRPGRGGPVLRAAEAAAARLERATKVSP